MANLRIAELDFDSIKTNLKTYLQSQTEFTDYDFEGSGLSVLLDVLAYNTHYNAYLANMLMNEMFLDSAVKRSSAVSIAKQLGYVPRSTRGSIATVDITVNNPTGAPSSLTLPAYTVFSSSINSSTYTFLNIEEITITPVAGVYTFSGVELVQGSPSTFTYTVGNSPGPAERFEIPNENVDTTTITVTVQQSVSDTTSHTYVLASDISSLDGTSKNYFLQENSRGRYEIYFGDGVIGKKLSPGNLVIIEYISSDGEETNVSASINQSFTTSSTIGGSSDINIEVIANSRGGSAKEGIDSIKFNAPLANAARNRAVTSKDYLTLLTTNVTEAESISVWGGEVNDPPIYGKVIISLKPYSGFTISQATKDYIKNAILANRKALAIQPEFVEPEYSYVNATISVKYNPNLTTYSTSQIETLVKTSIATYLADNIGKFNQNFYASRLIQYIFNLDPSIISACPEIGMQKRITPALNSVNTYTGDGSIKFYNRLHPSRFRSSYFYTNQEGTSTLVYFVDIPDSAVVDYNGTGTLNLYNATTGSLISTNYGTINYATGEVTINSLAITGYPAGVIDIKLTGELQEASYDISSVRNQILLLDESTAQPRYGILDGLTVTATQVIE